MSLRTVAAFAIFFASASPSSALDEAGRGSVVRVGRFYLQSNAWVNLHQRLIQEAKFGVSSPSSLTGDDLKEWKSAVAAYDQFIGQRGPLDEELALLNAALSETSGDTLSASIPSAAAGILRGIMPLYERTQWKEDDAVNRFWMSVEKPLLESAEVELAAAHARAYGTFPSRIRVDVSVHAGEFGAYSVGEGDFAHVVISSTHPLYRGFLGLEMLSHEASHAVADSAETAVIGAELAQAERELGIKPRRNLWHALLFYTSGELTRRALAARGVADYLRVIDRRWSGPFRGFKEPLETHWQAFLDGKLSRADAVKKIVEETSK
jgi:hypothetical protein